MANQGSGIRDQGSARAIIGTRLAWSTPREWLALVYREGDRCRCSTPAFDRCDRLYRSLRVEDIRSCRDVGALAGIERLFDLGRRLGPRPYGREIWRALPRASLGALLVETRNRLDALESGRAERRRQRGPRFDPPRLPEAALDRLIQQHPDLAIVEALRAERRRRDG